MGFSLVPWKPVVEQRLGQQVSGHRAGDIGHLGTGAAAWTVRVGLFPKWWPPLPAKRVRSYQVSIDRIAVRAHLARQTLYNHFPSKEALFEAVMRHAIQSILVTLDGETDVRATLLAFGNAYRKKLLSPDGLALFRTMTAEAPRFPDLATRFFRQGPFATRKHLSAYLGHAMGRGALRRDDPEFAAEMFTAMLADADRLRGLLDPQTGSLTRAKTVQVVDCFLRAFAPEKDRR